MTPTQEFDQLWVISDLHLGGEPGYQIFGSSLELVALVDHLIAQRPDQRVGLVINGDFVDFLAEHPATYFDPHGAVRKLERIATEDPNFKPVFDALRRYLLASGRWLIVNLGNHDLELALPWVRHRLTQLLTRDDAGAMARLSFVMDGTGVRTRVGSTSVLCLHGNEVDRWNPSDHERIRELARNIQFGLSVEPWVPNAGTRMVIDAMNGVKASYPFVDLLKPEDKAVFPVVAACDPVATGNLRTILGATGAVLQRATAAIWKPDGMLAHDGADFTPSPEQDVTWPIGCDRQAIAVEMLEEAEESLRRGIEPRTLLESDADQTLGLASAFLDRLRGKPRHEVLREALEFLDRDRSFDVSHEDDTYRALDAKVASDIGFLVAGHTHLRRALSRSHGEGYYFNSGTWARLARIPPDVRGDEKKFEGLFSLLNGGSIAQLDKAGIAFSERSVVKIWRASSGDVFGQLLEVRCAPVFLLEGVSNILRVVVSLSCAP